MIKYSNGTTDVFKEKEKDEDSWENYNPPPPVVPKTADDDDDGDDDNGLLALRILGWIIWACGILIILFANILGGLIISALGILFMVLGKKRNGSSDPKNKNRINYGNSPDL